MRLVFLGGGSMGRMDSRVNMMTGGQMVVRLDDKGTAPWLIL
jgi:hypothetical protein